MTTVHIIDSADLSMARALAYRFAGCTHDDDVESAAMGGLLKAAQTYDPERGEWVTYAYNAIHWAVLDELRKTKPTPMDPYTLPELQVVGIVTTGAGVERLKAALELLNAEDLLESLDMRRTRHRALVAQLRKVLA